MSGWKLYNKICREITEQQDIDSLEHSELRAWKGYHLDHIVPVHQGYRMSINPYLIGSLENLRFIPWRENMKQAALLTDDAVELLNRWNIDCDGRIEEYEEAKKRIYEFNRKLDAFDRKLEKTIQLTKIEPSCSDPIEKPFVPPNGHNNGWSIPDSILKKLNGRT